MATLVPHVYPVGAPGLPPYALGARLPRTARRAALWRALDRPVEARAAPGPRRAQRDAASGSGCRRSSGCTAASASGCASSATFPQLEYPRRWPRIGRTSSGRCCGSRRSATSSRRRATSRSCSSRPRPPRIPSTACSARRCSGSASEPVRVLAATNRKPLREPVPVPANAPAGRLALLLAHDAPVRAGDHATPATARWRARWRAGCPVLAVPHSGDMGENAARADWAGVGVRLPWRLLTPATLRLAVRRALRRAAPAPRGRERSPPGRRQRRRRRGRPSWSRRLRQQLQPAARQARAARCARTNSMSSGASPLSTSTGSP